MPDQDFDPALAPHELADANSTPPGEWALYGATGLTGRMVLARALEQGLRPRLIGRDSPALHALAADHGLECRIASLDRPHSLVEALGGFASCSTRPDPMA